MVDKIDGNYKNMGATIIDGILQAGINYKKVVKPRVDGYLEKYPDKGTVKNFKDLYDSKTLAELIGWTGFKVKTIEELTKFLIDQKVDTEEEFREWLKEESNINKLMSVKGIGKKTASYFEILVGHSTSAIDRHLDGFLRDAGLGDLGYSEAQQIISEASVLLGVEESYFDHSIWRYKSMNKTRRQPI